MNILGENQQNQEGLTDSLRSELHQFVRTLDSVLRHSQSVADKLQGETFKQGKLTFLSKREEFNLMLLQLVNSVEETCSTALSHFVVFLLIFEQRSTMKLNKKQEIDSVLLEIARNILLSSLQKHGSLEII